MENSISTTKPLEASSKDRVFTKFPELPAELRLRILDFAALQNQIVRLEVKQEDFVDLTTPPSSTVRAPSIGMLSATYETRSTILKDWKPSFRSWTMRPIYFNPDRDVLFLMDRSALSKFASSTTTDAEAESTRFIALNPSFEFERLCGQMNSGDYDIAIWESYFLIRTLLKNCRNLDEIVFTVEKYSNEENARLTKRLKELYDSVQGMLRLEFKPCPRDWVNGKVPRMPVFSLLNYNPTPEGIAEMDEELVARRMSAARLSK